MKAPTEKQIRLVENICFVLNISNFPSSSKEFTRYNYSQFIAAHMERYTMECEPLYYDEEDYFNSEMPEDPFYWL